MKKKRIHYLEVFIFQDVYPKYGVVWQMACKRKINAEYDDLDGTTNPDDVTCKRCRKYLNS